MVKTRDDSGTSVPPSRAGDWVYGSVLALPLALLLGLFAWGAVRELRAERAMEILLDDLEEQGSVDGSESMQESFDRRTTRANSARWSRILAATAALETRYWIADRVETFRDVVPPGQPWEAEALAMRLSEDAQAILTELEELGATAEPVWQPILFEDYRTLLPELQKTRSLTRLLSNEFTVAYHSGDHQRAMHALELIQRVAQAFDTQTFLVGDLIHLSHIGQHRTLIRNSLAAEYWTLDELDQLRQQLAFEDDLDARWQRVIDSEMSLMREAPGLDGDDARPVIDGMGVMLGPFGIAPTHELAILRAIQQLRSLESPGTASHPQRASDASDQVMSNFASLSAASVVAIPFATPSPVMGLLMPAFEAVSEVYTRTERERRWAACAIAIKQFEMQEGHWPGSLDDLERVGLARVDWEAAPGQPFGYQVSDDGSEVFLWTSTPGLSELTLEPVPPHTIEEHALMLESMEVTIR